jgi:hypothetical protein
MHEASFVHFELDEKEMLIKESYRTEFKTKET